MGKVGAFLISGLVGVLLALLVAVALDDAPADAVAVSEKPDAVAADPPSADDPDASQPSRLPKRRRASPNERFLKRMDARYGDVFLLDAAPCNVRVVSADGKPVRGADVSVCNHPLDRFHHAGVTGDDGRLRIEIVPFDGYVCAHFGDLVSTETRFVPPEIAEQPGEIELRLQPGIRIRGQAARPDGSPAAGLKVWIHGDWPRFRLAETVTAADGSFEFPIRATESEAKTVWFDVIGDERVEAAIDPKDPAAPLRLEVPWKVEVLGRCVTADGKPIANPDSPSEILRMRLPAVASPGRADVLRYVGSEKWEARVAWQGPGPVIDLGDVVFRPQGPMRGVVADPAGAPVPDAGVNMLPSLGLQPVFTDSAGRFSIDALPRSAILVRATLTPPPAEDGTVGPSVRAWTIVDEATLAAAEPGVPLRITVSPNPVARLRAVTSTGEKLDAINAVLRGKPELSPRPRIDDGIACFALVGPGPWEIDVTAIRGLTGRLVISAGESLERDVVVGE